MASQKFKHLPETIFGKAPNDHRMHSINLILRGYKIKTPDTKKVTALGKLAELERKVSDREKAMLTAWFGGENKSLKAIGALLHDARRRQETKQRRRLLVRKPEHPVTETATDTAECTEVKKCRICMEFIELAEFPRSRITITCTHQPAVCGQCLTSYINAQMKIRPRNEISCPEPECPGRLSHAEIGMYISQDVIKGTNNEASVFTIQHLPNFSHCLRAGCDRGQIHEAGPSQPMVICDACGYKTCFNHKLPWHDNLTCAEFDSLNPTRLKQEAASDTWLTKHTKLCPNPECGMRTQKEAGCDQLNCDYCLHKFCWICLADSRSQRDASSYHKEDCKYRKKGIPGHGGSRTVRVERPEKDNLWTI